MPEMASCLVIAVSAAVWLWSVVPVLPATGLPTMPLVGPAVAPLRHMPYWDWSPTGQRAASEAARATSTGITWLQRGVAAASLLPLKSWMEITGSGVQYLPSAARVAYAFATSSGVDPDTPSVKPPQSDARSRLEANSKSLGWSGVPCARNWMPIDLAVSTTLSAPTFCSSGTKNVFTDLPNASQML